MQNIAQRLKTGQGNCAGNHIRDYSAGSKML